MLPALLLSLCASYACADLAGVTVNSGDCLCVSGTGINARDQPGTSGSTVVGIYNSGTCFKATGTKTVAGSYTWYELDTGSQRLWIAGNYLIKGSSTQCDAGSCGEEVKNLACQLLNSPNVQTARAHASRETDNAFAYNNLYDLCNGRTASRSSYTCPECKSGQPAPGGSVCVSLSVLKYLVALKNKGRIYINELAGACHSCTSSHYRGLAVDLNDGSRDNEYVETCKSMGGIGIDEKTHIHCQFTS